MVIVMVDSNIEAGHTVDKADLLSPVNFVTVVETPEPVGKHIILNEEGEPVKDRNALSIVSRGTATTLSAATPQELAEIIRGVGDNTNKVLILSHLKDSMPGDTYQIITTKKMTQMTSGETHAGVYTRDGVLFATRTKDNFLPSNWLLLDRDITDEMPRAMANLSFDEWMEAMTRIWPGMNEAARVVVPSTTGRVCLNAEPMEASGAHVYIRAALDGDLKLLKVTGTRLLAAAMGNKLSFHKISISGASRPWSIYDPTTFSSERLVFDGKPRVTGEGLTVSDCEIQIVEGSEADPTLIPELTGIQKQGIKRKYGLGVEGNTFTQTSSLTMNTIIDTKDYGKIPLKKLLMKKLPASGKWRTQVPFRPESQSTNGFVAIHDGVPFLFDNGTRIKYVIKDEEVIREGPNKVSIDDQRKFTRKQGAKYMNERYFVIQWGGAMRIVDTQAVNDFRENELGAISKAGLMLRLGNRKVRINGYFTPIVPWWLASEVRREYKNMVFQPDKKPGPTKDDNYNRWQGFAVEPVQGDWSLLRAHIELMCSQEPNSPELTEYLLDWFAFLVQHPGMPHGTVLALSDPKGGTGKSMLLGWFKAILGRHAWLASSAREVSGKFNAHLVDKVFVAAEESVFTGDHQAAERLKVLIDGKSVTIEPKGVDAYDIPNNISYAISANMDHIANVAKNQRRWTVISVPTEHAEDRSYFSPLVEQVNNGGLEAMLYDLLNRDISDFDQFFNFHTEALNEQVNLSLDPLDRYLVDAVEANDMNQHHERGDYGITDDDVVPFDSEISLNYIYKQYKAQCRIQRAHHPLPKQAISSRLSTYLGHLPEKTRRKHGLKDTRVRDSIWYADLGKMEEVADKLKRGG